MSTSISLGCFAEEGGAQQAPDVVSVAAKSAEQGGERERGPAATPESPDTGGWGEWVPIVQPSAEGDDAGGAPADEAGAEEGGDAEGEEDAGDDEVADAEPEETETEEELLARWAAALKT